MNLRYKTYSAAHTKTLDEAQGIAEHIVSVFNNVDHGGDRILPGFFEASIKNKLPKGVWAHDWEKPVAKTLEARALPAGDPLLPEEIKHLGGMYVKAQYNLQTQNGREAFSNVSGGFVDEFSIGYSVEEANYDAKTGITDLVKGAWYEWSPVLWGMNPLTQHLSAKSRSGAKMADTLDTSLIRLKSVLGDELPSRMTMAAISRANDALYYFFWDAIYYADNADAAQNLEEACDEFKALVLMVYRAIMGGTAEQKQSALTVIKSLYREPRPETDGGSDPEAAAETAHLHTLFLKTRARVSATLQNGVATNG